MSDFWMYVKLGLNHVLDIKGYDHVLFLIALTVPYVFRDWKRILLLVSVFTIGHTTALLLAVFRVVTIKAEIVEFLIPITILMTAIFALISAGKSAKAGSNGTVLGITLLFGIVHGLGFSNYFVSMLGGKPSDQILPLLEFALGIEIAQVIVVVAVLIIGFMVQKFLKFSRRDWTLVASAFVIGVVVPLILENEIWKG